MEFILNAIPKIKLYKSIINKGLVIQRANLIINFFKSQIYIKLCKLY